MAKKLHTHNDGEQAALGAAHQQEVGLERHLEPIALCSSVQTKMWILRVGLACRARALK